MGKLLERNIFSGITITLVLICIFVLAFNVQSCESSRPVMGTLDLTANVVSDTEVVLKLTFNALHSMPEWKFGMDIREGPQPSGLGMGVLPEGLELVSGDLVWEGYNNVEQVSIEAKVRAVLDGEWRVQGYAVRVEGTWDNYGALDARSTEVLTIIVSNGIIISPQTSPPYPLYIGLVILCVVVAITIVYIKKRRDSTQLNNGYNQHLIFMEQSTRSTKIGNTGRMT
jgi:hypothetical protein